VAIAAERALEDIVEGLHMQDKLDTLKEAAREAVIGATRPLGSPVTTEVLKAEVWWAMREQFEKMFTEGESADERNEVRAKLGVFNAAFEKRLTEEK